jgi:hypothetical protein
MIFDMRYGSAEDWDEGDEEDREAQRFHQPLIGRRLWQMAKEHRGQGTAAFEALYGQIAATSRMP